MRIRQTKKQINKVSSTLLIALQNRERKTRVKNLYLHLPPPTRVSEINGAHTWYPPPSIPTWYPPLALFPPQEKILQFNVYITAKTFLSILILLKFDDGVKVRSQSVRDPTLGFCTVQLLDFIKNNLQNLIGYLNKCTNILHIIKV